jgi:Spy/CpxP family protein refolding chaperone
LAMSCVPMRAQEPQEPADAPMTAEMLGPVEPGFAGDPGMVEPDGPRRGGPGERGGWERGRGEFRGGRGRHGFELSRLLSSPEMQQKVGVSAEQVAKIRTQETAFRKSSIQQRADLEIKQLDLRELMAADKPDRAAIDRKLQEVSASRLAMDKSRVDFRLNMKDALTPEQREKLKAAMKEKWEARRNERQRGPGQRGPRGPRPGGGPGAGAPPPAGE